MNEDELKELERLVNRLFDGRASDADLADLDRQMSGARGAKARDFYLKYAQVQAAIADHGAQLSLAETQASDLARLSTSDADRSQAATPARRLHLVVSALATAAVLLIAFYGVWRPGGEQGAVAPAGGVAAEAEGALAALPRKETAKYIAELSVISPDAVWVGDTTSRDFMMRVRAGESIDLQAGLVQIDYFAGAQIILRGPCRYVPTGENMGRLEHGELTGHVSVGDFVLNTPTAKVVDLGTAFGVSVDADQSTDLHVLEGKVQFASVNQGGVTSDNALLLTRGMAARTIRGEEQTVDLPYDGERFARSIELPDSVLETGSLSLVDVMNSDRSGNKRLASGIAPDTGEAFQESALAELSAFPRRQRHGVYHITNWHDVVDGVFIPSADGQSVQIDSTGTEIQLPPSGANTSGPIWSRRRINDPSLLVFHKDFWGGQTLSRVLQRMQQSQTGMIGIHANVGVTFDLRAIRDKYGLRIDAFNTVVANLDNSDQFPAGPTTERRFIADFRVYLDGELRRSRLGFGRSDGDMRLRVPITEADRFLTVVSTEAGHYWYDQVVLIDPILELAD